MFFQIVGELLITAGILIGLFVVWTVWWTNVVGEKAIKEEVVEIHEEYGEAPSIYAKPQPGPPPEIAEPKKIGETIGIIHIPDFGYDHQTAIKEGTDNWVLDQGVFSHYKGTAMPGAVGNFSTAVHREVRGARMKEVEILKEGSPIVVETKDTYLVYKIVSTEIVDPTDIYVIQPDPFAIKEQWERSHTLQNPVPNRRLLTITTCHPLYMSTHRYIVHAEFDYWVKRSEGMPKELIDPHTLQMSENLNLNSENKTFEKQQIWAENQTDKQSFPLPAINIAQAQNISITRLDAVKEN
ncbi:class E sortase [Arcanobacterium hippocoleae]